MKAAVERWVKPYAKFIAAIVGVAAIFLSPKDADYIIGILTALGVYAIPNAAR